MREPDNILEVAALRPDFMGFIFYSQSPRCVPIDFTIPAEFPSSIKRVGVFVNEDFEKILSIVQRYNLDFVQLHGDESVAMCVELKEAGVSVIKVFSIGPDFNFEKTLPYKEAVDFFLFDTKGKFHGGNSLAFNWDLMKQYDQEIPFFLSGGISDENVKAVDKLKGMNLHAVDINSSVERHPGLKDVNKVKDFIEILNSKF